MNDRGPTTHTCHSCGGTGMVVNFQCLTFRKSEANGNASYRCQKLNGHKGKHVDHKGLEWG